MRKGKYIDFERLMIYLIRNLKYDASLIRKGDKDITSPNVQSYRTETIEGKQKDIREVNKAKQIIFNQSDLSMALFYNEGHRAMWQRLSIRRTTGGGLDILLDLEEKNHQKQMTKTEYGRKESIKKEDIPQTLTGMHQLIKSLLHYH